MYAPLIWIIVGSDNSLSSITHQNINFNDFLSSTGFIGGTALDVIVSKLLAILSGARWVKEIQYFKPFEMWFGVVKPSQVHILP